MDLLISSKGRKMEKDIKPKIRTSVFGILKDRKSLDKTLIELKQEKYINTDVSVLMKRPDMLAETISKDEAVAWLLGSRTIPIPNIGAVTAMGPVINLLASTKINDGIEGVITNLGFSLMDAKNCEGFIKEDKVFIAITVDDNKWLLRTKNLLTKNGAISISATIPSQNTEQGKKWEPKVEQNSQVQR